MLAMNMPANRHILGVVPSVLACVFALGCGRRAPASTSKTTASAIVSALPSASASAAAIAPSLPDAGSIAGVPRTAKTIDRVELLSTTEWWVRAEGRAWQTRDGGATFLDRTPFKIMSMAELEASFEGPWTDSLLATSSAVFLLRGDSNDQEVRTWTLFVSTDHGGSFTPHAINRKPSRGGALQEGPGGALLVRESDANGMNSHAELLLESLDHGTTFRELGSKTGYGAITFQTPTTWWTVGTCCASASGIFRSTDAGRHWTFRGGGGGEDDPVGFADAESDVVFIDSQRGYRIIEGLSGTIEFQRTTDGARSFAAAQLPFDPQEAPLYVLEADRNACILQHGVALFSTRHQGDTWARLPDLPGDLTLAGATTSGEEVVTWSQEELHTPSRLLRLAKGAKTWEVMTPTWSPL